MAKTGKQSPSFTNVPTTKYRTRGQEAIDLYRSTGQELLPWQGKQVKAIMRSGSGGIWHYIEYGLCVSRRNGKGEILAAREFWGIIQNNEKICHTAHRTTTSHDAFNRLYTLLKKAGYEEHSRKQKEMPERSFFASKQYGLEHIEISGGGIIDFRTRTNNGGLGEGFDLLVIDEAQEYTSKQASALSYTVTASKNPQTIITGTPPTASSGGDVFQRLRQSVIDGSAEEIGWAEWSIGDMPGNVADTKLWYRFNPSLGYILTERNIRAELANGEIDFAIQRLGLWLSYKRNACITPQEWEALQVERPALTEDRFFGVKYSLDGVSVAISVAARTDDGHIFVEAIDTAPTRFGNAWIVDYILNPHRKGVVIDGASGQKTLVEELRQQGVKNPVLPAVSEVIESSSLFETAIAQGTLEHSGQPELAAVVTNCEHRPIGSRGGYGFKTLTDDQDITIMESAVLAFWLCATTKPRKRQAISY